MKGFSVRQPYASLIAAGIKSVENRSYAIQPGQYFIHAAKKMSDAPADFENLKNAGFDMQNLPLGKIIAVVDIVACVWIFEDFVEANTRTFPQITAQDKSWWHAGSVGWLIRNVRAVDGPYIKGQAGIFHADF